MPKGSATYQQINPVTGLVTNEFEGHVSADGVDLLAGTSDSPPADRRIRWLRESDGALVASISSYENGAEFSQIAMEAKNSVSPFKAAGIYLTTDEAVDSRTVKAQAYPHVCTVLNAQGQSSFLQLGSVGKSKAGTIQTTFDGVNSFVISGNISHGFGSTPKVMVSIAEYFQAGRQLICMPYAVNSIQFAIVAFSLSGTPPNNTVINLNYIAWT